jgi:hypothetical protein
MNEPRDPADTDQRDETLASVLAVPPLDDVTRRRLVREALDRPVPRPSRFVAVAAVAAALALGAFVGTVLVTEPEQSDVTTAQRAPTVSADAESLESAPAGMANATASPVTPLGDLGDVSDAADLREAVDLGFERSAGPTEDSTILGYPCAANTPETFGLVAPSALGIGTYDGIAVTVVIGTSPAGQALAVVVQSDTCSVLANVRLPKG